MGLVVNHRDGFDAFVTPDGQHRLLSLTAPRPKAMSRVHDMVPARPRSEWRATTRLADVGDLCPRYDQGTVGCCEPTSEVEAIGGLRALMGLPTIPLSFAMLYAQVHRGVDQGASIGDGYAPLQQFGVCPLDMMPGGFYLREQVPPEAWLAARRYRAYKAYHCPTFAEIVTAILSGFWVVHGVFVGARFNDLDANGVTPEVRGAPNHAVSAWDVVALKGGNWGLRDCNHWGRRWGLDGDFITTERAYDLQSYQDAIAYEVVSVDEDVDLPPIGA